MFIYKYYLKNKKVKKKIKIYDFSKTDEVASIEFEPDDIVRNPIITKIIDKWKK